MKINGYAIPIREVSYIVIAAMWLAGLSWQVNSNADEINNHPSNVERLARIEEKQEAVKEDITEIKKEQKDQSIVLFKILEKVVEHDAKAN